MVKKGLGLFCFIISELLGVKVSVAISWLLVLRGINGKMRGLREDRLAWWFCF